MSSSGRESKAPPRRAKPVPLYQALATVLGDDAIRAAELADRVNRTILYERRDGRPVPAYQVATTVHAYRDVFDVDAGVITLRDAGTVDGVRVGVADAVSAHPTAALPGDRITRGIAGEHFVCGELAKRGWIATLTAKNTPRVDVLAHRTDSGRAPVAIQVKTRSTAYRRAWRVGRTEGLLLDGFYVFVDLGDLEEAPAYWIVPAAEVGELLASEQIRTSDIASRRDRWDLLEPSKDR